MTDHKKYFDENGVIYGVSSKYNCGWWHRLYIFDDWDEAIDWLHAEEYDFRERELLTREEAVDLVGGDIVDATDENGEQGEYLYQ